MRAFVIGLPKCGTCSIHRSLTESGFNAVHQSMGNVPVAAVIYRNLLFRDDIFYGLEEVDAVTQPDAIFPGRNLVYWPQMDFTVLRTIHEQYPDCRFILNTRDVDDHVRSIGGWDVMRWRLTVPDIPGLPSGFGATEGELRRWILGHYANVRAFGIPHTEVRIDGPNAREQLSEAVGCEIKWWGVENANKRLAKEAAE